MANTIKLKRGNKADISNLQLVPGELGVAIDTQELYIGDQNGTVQPIKAQAAIPEATSTILGTVRLGSDIVNTNIQAELGSTMLRTYLIQKDSGGKLCVNVPWTNTTYSGMTQTEIDEGTVTTNRVVTPKLLVDNFAKKREVGAQIEQVRSGQLSQSSMAANGQITLGTLFPASWGNATDNIWWWHTEAMPSEVSIQHVNATGVFYARNNSSTARTLTTTSRIVFTRVKI